jgi:Anti-sigma-K factor rskA
MDHETALEALEIAAAEPGGLDRLMAGDTQTAMAVAAHLAGCPECTLELERWQRVHADVAQVIGETPSPELRGRTLAYVRAKGVPRGADVGSAAAAATLAAVPVAAVPPASAAPEVAAANPVAASPAPPTDIAAARDRRRWALGWVGAVAAAVVISVLATSLLVGSRVDDRLASQDRAIEDLASVTTATLNVIAEPDSQRVALVGAPGTDASGTLLYSPTTTELVVVATGLTEPIPGREYKCWVVVDGTRQNIGKMFFGGGLAYWAGPSPAVADLPAGGTFGVSLMDADGATVAPDPVLASAT